MGYADGMGAARFRGGHPPLGYRWGGAGRLTVDRRRAPLVRRIFREYVRQGSLSALAAHLARRGPLNRGRPWSRQALLWILKNPAYRGAVAVGPRLARGAHPALVPAAAFTRVQRMLARRRRRGNPALERAAANADERKRKGDGNPVTEPRTQAQILA